MKKYQKIPKVTMPMGAVFSSSPRSAAPHGCWSTERCARFAARREYHLIKSLVNDRATLAAARDAGLIAAAQSRVTAISTSTPDGGETAKPHKEEVQPSKKTRRVKTDACKAKEQRKLEEKVAKRAAAAKAEKERQAVEAAVAASKKAAEERAAADAVEAEKRERAEAEAAKWKEEALAAEQRRVNAERERRDAELARVREEEERKARAAAEAEKERRLRAELAAAREVERQHAEAEVACGYQRAGQWADDASDGESGTREAGGKRGVVDAGLGTPAKAAGAPAVESGGSERREHRARRIDFGGKYAAEKGGGKGSSKGGGRGKWAFGKGTGSLYPEDLYPTAKATSPSGAVQPASLPAPEGG